MVNASPTFTYSITETNENVITQLGSSSANSIIQNASIVNVTVTPVALKHATISAVNVVYNGLTYTTTTSPYTILIPIANSNVFTFNIIDSRGYSTSGVDNNRTLINYEAVKTNTFSFKRYAPTSSDVIFNGEFTYWSSIGSISNTPVVKWKLDDGSWNTIPSTNYSIDTTNHKLTINNYTLSNVLVYTLPGQFTIYIEDKLTTDFVTSDNGKVTIGVPTFEAGEHDLQINGTLYIADTSRANRKSLLDLTYPVGSIYISVNSTNPSNLFGGTWVAFGTGRTLVGIDTNDTDFDSVEETGGSKFLQKHTHTISNFGYAGYQIEYTNVGGGNSFPNGVGKITIDEAGTGESGNLQPYITVYMWKRTY